MCRFSILQETVRGEGERLPIDWGIVTLNLTFRKWGILVIVTKDAIHNTNQAPIFEDNLQPAPMAEEIQSAQRAEKQR